jgi:predicted TIM-barrel fold metal-dependent hydrolase
MIVDAQVHVWPAETAERPWLRPGDAHLPKPFGYDDLRIEMARAGVDRAILIPPGWEGDRIDFVLAAAAHHPDRFAAMGRIPVQDPRSIALLPDWKRQAGMLGIRLSFQKQHNHDWLHDGTADWFWPAAEQFGIPVMVFAPNSPNKLREIAINHPGLTLVVDHMGLLREQDEAAATGIEGIIPLADCPNVHVKVTSVPLYSSEPYPYRNLHAPLRRLIAAFGPQRSFWGTDITRIWSRALLPCSYRQCVTLFTDELEFLSADDLEWVMGRGIVECLQWRYGATGGR